MVPLRDPSEPTAKLTFFGGVGGALAPFVVFLTGISWLGLAGAPDETGFWPIVLLALIAGLGLAHDRSAYADAVVDGMSRRLVMIMVLAWILAGVLGTLLRESGLVDALVWATSVMGVSGGGYAVAAFLVCVVFSVATGTSLGTLLVCAPLLYPAGAALHADPAFLMGAIIAGATFGDNVSPISDTTIASATTQEADLGGVVRSRLRYALPAAAIAITVFGIFGGAQGGATVTLDISPDAAGLTMLLVPALVLTLLVRRSHLVTGLIAGIVTAAVLGMVLGRFGVGDLIGIDRDNFIATGLILDGMRRAHRSLGLHYSSHGDSWAGVEAAGLLDRLITWIRQKAAQAQQAEWWIFGSVTARDGPHDPFDRGHSYGGRTRERRGRSRRHRSLQARKHPRCCRVHVPVLAPILHSGRPRGFAHFGSWGHATALALERRGAQRALVGTPRGHHRGDRDGMGTPRLERTRYA